jgi:hypothetical protein
MVTNFLSSLNAGSGFGGANGWRPPTIVELQTIVLDFSCSGYGTGPQCSCPSSPCIASALDSANTVDSYYWSATSVLGVLPASAWVIDFETAYLWNTQKGAGTGVRAVRGGF